MTPETQEGRAAAGQATVFLLLLLTIFRLAYASQLGMAEDETYYWQWSRHLASSYYDQGPGVAYLIHLGTLLCGNTPLGVRLPTVLLGAATAWLTFLTVRRWSGRALTGLLAVVLLNVLPLFAVGSVIATYDSPQVFCWAAALYALTWTLQEDRAGGWYVVGFLTGLGLLCKLTMLLFAPGALLFLIWSPEYRKWLRTPHPYLAFVFALALFTPVLQWNATHDWMGFKHSLTLGSRRRGAAPFRWFGDFLGGQFAIGWGPLLFPPLLYVLVRLSNAAKRYDISANAGRFFVSFAAPTLVVCLVLSLKSKLELNWPAPMYLAGAAAIAIVFHHAWQVRTTLARPYIVAAIAFSAAICAVVYYPGLLRYIINPCPADLGQKLNQTFGWQEIADNVQAVRTDLERAGKPVFIAGINYRVNSAMAFYLPDHPETQGLFLDSRRDQYFIWTDPKQLIGENAVLCLDTENADAIRLARKLFSRVEFISAPDIRRPGFKGPVKQWYLYACFNFKGYNPNQFVDGY